MVAQNKRQLLQEFMDKYVACIYISDINKAQPILDEYKKILDCFIDDCLEETILYHFEMLAKMKISLGIPYISVSNEIFGLKSLFIKKNLSSIDLAKLLDVFYKINNLVAKLYLDDYVKKLRQTNLMRINSLSEVMDLSIIRFYKYHLLWLNDLIARIADSSKQDFPELDPALCDFGKWLKKDAKLLLQNNSKYKTIVKMHNALHIFASKINKIILQDEYHILISYLEKCELLSLRIGTELVLADNIEINKKVTKDALTGALNRHALKPIFETQYELAYATDGSFVLALMDIDDFKNVNDTYGHIAGDKLLGKFVEIVKKDIRNSDVIVRYGGEEFVVFLPSISISKALEVLHKIKEHFSKTSMKMDTHTISATVSIGVVEVKPQMQFVSSFTDEYLMIVDKKMYQAKQSGKNKVVF